MKNYKIEMIKKIITSVVLIVGLIGHSQEDILFSFDNVETTNDGVDNFYEVDVMLKTTTAGTFKLGSGQLYFNYNTAAFGSNIGNTAAFDVSYPDDYIIAQKIAAFAVPFYGDFEINNNLTSRVSWGFDQVYSSLTIANDNVGPTSAKLIHIKFKYIDVNEDPMLEFHSGGVFEDLFFTACGSEPGSGVTAGEDCENYPNIQLTNDTFNNNNVLGTDNINSLVEFSIFPNPTKGLVHVNINKASEYKFIDMLGKIVVTGILSQGKNELHLENYEGGVYFLHISNNSKVFVKKIILE